MPTKTSKISKPTVAHAKFAKAVQTMLKAVGKPRDSEVIIRPAPPKKK